MCPQSNKFCWKDTERSCLCDCERPLLQLDHLQVLRQRTVVVPHRLAGGAVGVLLFERSRQCPGVRPQDGGVATVPQHHLRFKKKKKKRFTLAQNYEGKWINRPCVYLPDTAQMSLCHKTKAEAAGKGTLWSGSGCKWSRLPSVDGQTAEL